MKALEMIGITKAFPGVKALDNVTFSVDQGEIHAICGENGAGKSTLMKVISGVYPYGEYQGELRVHGEECRFKNVNESQAAGVAIIHQELAIIPELTVAENIFLNHPNMRKCVIDWDWLFSEASRWLKEMELEISPDSKAGDLSVARQQLVEIAKALAKETNILILDEPTASLTESEVELLKSILKRLRNKGVTCIYISHKLNEVMELADTVTVLRDGRVIRTDPVSRLTEKQIIQAMVGRDILQMYPYRSRKIGKEILSFHNYSVFDSNSGRPVAQEVNLTLHEGEVLGISGLVGAGRTEWFTAFFSGTEKKEGEVRLDGRPFSPKNARESIRAGVAYVSEDRKRYGLIMNDNIVKNTTLASLNRIGHRGVIDIETEIYETEKQTQRLKLKASSLEVAVHQLSGGNQQKVVLSKWLMTDPRILILDEPTRGIDVGAKTEIYQLIMDLADRGVGVILISSDLPEIVGMSDRIIVMAEGRIRGEFLREEATQENIMASATGDR